VATNHNFRIKNGLEVGGTVIVSSDGVMTIPTDSTGSTQDGGTNNTRLATTAFVQQEITSLIGGAPGSLDTLNELAAAINDDSSYATTLTTALGLKAPKASPTFTGTSTFTDSIDLAYSSGLTNFYLFCNRTASQTLNIASYALDAGTDTYINIGKNTGTNSGTTTTVSIGDDASGSLVQTLGNFKTWGTITATSGIGMATGHSSGKFAVMASSVHGSYDFYNNGTSYFNGSVTVDDVLNVTGTNKAIQMNGVTRINGVGDIIGTSYYVGADAVIDTSRNITAGRVVTTGLYGTGHGSSMLPIWQYNSSHLGYGFGYVEGSPDSFKFDVSNNLVSGTPDFEISENVARVNGNTVYHVGNDGSGTGLDADLLDGVQGSNYARLDQSNVFGAGTHSNYFRRNNTTNYTTAPLLVESYGGSSTTTGVGFHISGSVGRYLFMNNSGDLFWNSTSSEIWHASNDGSGSGLDADLLDGQHGSYYAPASSSTAGVAHGYLALGQLTSGMDTTNLDLDVVGNASIRAGSYLYFGVSSNNYGSWKTRIGSANTSTMYINSQGININNTGYANPAVNWLTANASTFSHKGNTIWHAGNDGSGSGLDADTLDGVQGASYLRSDASDSYAGTLTMNGMEFRSDTNTARNLKLRANANAGGTDTGISGHTANGGWAYQLYGTNTGYYGFLDGNWAGWDIQKLINGAFKVDEGSGLQRVWNAGNDGSGSGLDADLLDGQHGSYYYSAGNPAPNQTITLSGAVTGSGTTSISTSNPYQNSVTFQGSNGNSPDSAMEYTQASGVSDSRLAPSTDWYNKIRMGHGDPYNYYGNTIAVKMTGTGYGDLYTMTVSNNSTGNWNKHWHANNDGSGSTLDADLLDGQHASAFATLSGSNSFSNSYNEFGNSTGSVSNDGGWNARVNIAGSNHARLDVKSVSDGIITSMFAHTGNAAGKVGTYSNHPLHLMINGSSKAVLSTAGSLSTTPQGTLWGASNDGSGSGLDADLLDGLDSSAFARLGGTNHLRSIPNRWFATADADNTIDYYTHAYAKAHMGNTYKYTTSRPAITSDSSYWVGSIGWGQIDLNTIFSYGSGFWDSWSTPSNSPGGTSHWTGLNALHYSANTGNAQYGMQQAMGAGNPSLFYVRGIWGGGFTSWRRIWNDGNDGSGSGLDADLLDGQQGSYYLAYGNLTGTPTIPTIPSNNVVEGGTSYSGEYPMVARTAANTIYSHDGIKFNGAQNKLTVAGSVVINGSTSWHAGNDGSSSGLDADLLDGRHLSQVARFQSSSDFADGTLVTTNINSGNTNGDSFVIEVTGKAYGSSRPHSIIAEGYLYNNTIINTNGTNISGSNFTYLKVMNISGNLCFWWPRHGYWNSYDVFVRSSSGGTANYNRVTAITNSTDPSSATKKIQINLATSWTSANDGSGSGLDADTLDGLNLSASTTNNGANLVMRTDANGYANFGWIYTASGAASGTLARIYCSEDGYLRYLTPSSLGTSWLRENTYNNLIDSTGASGNMNTVFNNNRSGNIDVWSGSNLPSGTSHVQGIQVRHSTTNHYGFQFVNQYNQSKFWARSITNNSFGSWQQIWSAHIDGSGSGLDADLLDGMNSGSSGSSIIMRTESNGYSQLNNWTQVGGTGLYSATANGAHFYPNTAVSYGTWRINGSRGGYTGTYYDYGGVVASMYDSSGNGGDWNGTNGWQWHWHRSNSCLAVAGSTTSSTYSLYVGGQIYATSNITAYSDRRVKENIIPIDNALEKVNGLQGVYYNRIDDEDKTKEIGFIAQEVNEVVPELVTYAEDIDQYGVKYGNTTALLVEAVKELTQQVKDLKQEIKEIKEKR